MIGDFLSRILRFLSADQRAKDAHARRVAERNQKALANFPFELVETSGENALATWEELKKAGRGVPVVLGKDLDVVLDPFHPDRANQKTVAETLAAAQPISFPEGLFALRRDEDAAASASLEKLGISAESESEADEEPLGEWPEQTGASAGLAVAYDVLTRVPFPKVYIALIPTDDPTSIPAHLRWGGWNACPPPEYHVAALRHWRDRYGAELVGLNHDTLNLRVTRKPATREAALDLARVQYAYCNDIVDQGVGSISALAAELMAHDWWFFWWD